MSLKHFSLTPVEDRNNWRTPPEIYAWADTMFSFDIDLAASAENALCEKFFTLEDNALQQDWHLKARRGFLNPPYDDISPWVDKALIEADKGFTTVMLIPSPNGEAYYGPLLERACEWWSIIGRLAFLAGADYTIPAKKLKSGKVQPERHIKKGEPVPGNNRGSALFKITGNVRYPLGSHRIAYRDKLMAEYAEAGKRSRIRIANPGVKTDLTFDDLFS